MNLRIKIGAVLVAALTLAGVLTLGGALAATPAASHHRLQVACATRAEYQQVHLGQPLRQVQVLLHQRGWVMTQTDGVQLREFKACRWWSGVRIGFTRDGTGSLQTAVKTAVWH